MKRVGAFEAKTHLSQLLTEVEQMRCTITIQRRGKDVALLAPCDDASAGLSERERERIVEELRGIRARQRKAKPDETLKELIEEGRKR